MSLEEMRQQLRSRFDELSKEKPDWEISCKRLDYTAERLLNGIWKRYWVNDYGHFCGLILEQPAVEAEMELRGSRFETSHELGKASVWYPNLYNDYLFDMEIPTPEVFSEDLIIKLKDAGCSVREVHHHRDLGINHVHCECPVSKVDLIFRVVKENQVRYTPEAKEFIEEWAKTREMRR